MRFGIVFLSQRLRRFAEDDFERWPHDSFKQMSTAGGAIAPPHYNMGMNLRLAIVYGNVSEQ